jgi:hypothetical protein
VQVRKDSGDEVVQDVAAGAREEVYRIGKHRFIRITLV